MRGRSGIMAVAMTVATASPLLAQTTPGVDGLGEARLTVAAYGVWILREEAHDWEEANPDTRLYAGDSFSTGVESRTELAVGSRVFFRLAERSEAKIAELTSLRVRIQLVTGLAQLVRWNGTRIDTEIETPTVVFRALEEGVYRFSADPGREWSLTVLKGKAEAMAPQGRVEVEQKQRIRVRGKEEPEYIIVKAPKPDEWDRWNRNRDNYLAHRDPGNWCLTLSGGLIPILESEVPE